MRVVRIESNPFHVIQYREGCSLRAPLVELPFIRAEVDWLPDAIDALVATSDLQGVVSSPSDLSEPRWLGVAVAEELLQLRQRGALPPPDRTGVILAGDFYPGADAGDVSRVWNAFASSARWVAGVRGNHDMAGPELRGTVLDGQIATRDGLRIAGIGGVVSAATCEGHRTETQFCQTLSQVLQQEVDILLMHDGPNVPETTLAGWPSVRQTIERAERMLVIRGHDHWPVAVAELQNGSQVLNVEGRVIVIERNVQTTTARFSTVSGQTHGVI